MPQQWLANLKKSRRHIAEALEDLCAASVSKKTSLPVGYVLKVVRQKGPDEQVVNYFWECMRRRKEDYEAQQKRKSDR